MVTVDVLLTMTSGRRAEQHGYHGADAILPATKSAVMFAEVNAIGSQAPNGRFVVFGSLLHIH